MSKTLFYPYKSGRKFAQILNIGITSTSKEKVLAFVRDSISHRSKFFIVTPNPEIILQAQDDERLLKALNLSDFALADGIGLAQAAKFLSLSAPKNKILRVPVYFFEGLWVGLATFFDKQWLFKEIKPIKGKAMFLELTKLANKKHWKIFLLGGKVDEAKAAAEALSRSLKGVKIDYEKGPVLNSSGEPVSQTDMAEEKNAIARINNFAPQILFVGFGAPKQEKWTSKWYRKLNIGGAMVVGGTFNYISGRTSLPPKWMEEIGLEWLWRLITQPWRLPRIIKAVFVFPIKVLLYKFKQ